MLVARLLYLIDRSGGLDTNRSGPDVNGCVYERQLVIDVKIAQFPKIGETSVEFLDGLADLMDVPSRRGDSELESQHVRKEDEVVAVREGSVRDTGQKHIVCMQIMLELKHDPKHTLESWVPKWGTGPGD